MLVLTRTVGQRIFIDTNCDGRIVIEVIDASRGRVRIGVTAPDYVPVNREEIAPFASDIANPADRS